MLIYSYIYISYIHRFFAVDLLEGCTSTECGADVLLSGYLHINIDLTEVLDETHQLICYGFSPDTLDIDLDDNARITKACL